MSGRLLAVARGRKATPKPAGKAVPRTSGGGFAPAGGGKLRFLRNSVSL